MIGVFEFLHKYRDSIFLCWQALCCTPILVGVAYSVITLFLNFNFVVLEGTKCGQVHIISSAFN